MDIDDYERQINYYEKRMKIYSTMINRLINSFSYKSHSWYRNGRVIRSVQHYLSSLNLKKKDNLIEYLTELFKAGEVDVEIESYKWDKIIKEIYNFYGEPIYKDDLYKLSSNFIVAPISSLNDLMADYKYFHDRAESLHHQIDGLKKSVVKPTSSNIKTPEEDVILAVSNVDKAIELVNNRDKEMCNYNTTYDFIEEIKSLLGCTLAYDRNSVESQLELLFSFDRFKESNEVVWFNDYCEKAVDLMVLYIDNKLRGYELSSDVSEFLYIYSFGEYVDWYRRTYKDVAYEHKSTLSPEEIKKLITPEKMVANLNAKLANLAFNYISLLPEDCEKNVNNMTLLTQYFEVKDIAKLYKDIIENEISESGDCYDYQEAKDLLQYAFASVIVARMAPIEDNLDDTAIKEEKIKRMAAVCIDYFKERPSNLIDSQGSYSNFTEGYAKDKLNDAELINEQMAKYYYQKEFQQALDDMKFSNFAQFRKGE